MVFTTWKVLKQLKTIQIIKLDPNSIILMVLIVFSCIKNCKLGGDPSARGTDPNSVILLLIVVEAFQVFKQVLKQLKSNSKNWLLI